MEIRVRTVALYQVLVGMSMAGYQEATISFVPHAIRVEGHKEGAEDMVLHVWSKKAEDTADSAGKGERKLTEEECRWLDKGKCPICESHEQLYKGDKSGLALSLYCNTGHLFWVAPLPFEPEYCGMKEGEEERKVEEPQEEAIKELKEEVEGGAE